MSSTCCNHTPEDLRDSRYRRVLWAVLVINVPMFLIEVVAGLASRSAFWHVVYGTMPEAATMGAVGAAALLANAATFPLLWAYRSGSRNDVIGSFAVLLAALGVFNAGQGSPGILVAIVMAGFALQGAWLVIRLALAELQVRHVH